MKPGITHDYLARRFKQGWTMSRLAIHYQCERYDVEYAVWKVMVREEKKRQVRKK